jgi:hypothetical protein
VSFRVPAIGALALALILAGCGGDDEEPETAATSPPPPTAETTVSETEQTASEPQATEEAPEAETEPEPETEAEQPETSPEDEPGGAGDEEAARSLALFTGEGERVRPRVVRVPAFISIRVELRSKDGNPYALTIGGKSIEVGDEIRSISTTLDGLRPGDAYVGTLMGAEGRVRVEATAEPGP